MSEANEVSETQAHNAMRDIARWVLSFDSAALPARSIEQAKLLVLDSLGCALAATDEAAAKATLQVVASQGGAPQCTVIGTPWRTSILNAVLANGVLTRTLDLNDFTVNDIGNGSEIGGHPSDNIPVALAVGEARGCRGIDILAAIVIGYELFSVLRQSIDYPGIWDGTTISGLVAPAMAGRLMGLTEDQLAHGLALGAARAPTPAAVRRIHVSSSKSLSNALIAQSGVLATLLAEQGTTGPLTILRHKYGLRQLFPKGIPALVAGKPLADDFYIMQSNVKAYPCLGTGLSAVAASLALHEKLGAAGDQIARIELSMTDSGFIRRQQGEQGDILPDTREAADHSFKFLVAVALTDGVFGKRQFENTRWKDPAILALMGKIVLKADASWRERAPLSFPCSLRVTLRDGQDHFVEVPYPPGFSHGGIDPAVVKKKFHDTATNLTAAQRDAVIAAALSLNGAPSSAGLMASVSLNPPD